MPEIFAAAALAGKRILVSTVDLFEWDDEQWEALRPSNKWNPEWSQCRTCVANVAVRHDSRLMNKYVTRMVGKRTCASHDEHILAELATSGVSGLT